MVFYERASGSRMHAAYLPRRRRAPGPAAEADRRHRGVLRSVPQGASTTSTTLLTGNRIFKQRNVDIGVVTLKDAWEWGFSGVMVRGSGAAWDLRKSQPYECYAEMDFDIPIGKNGDCYDRYLDPHGRDAPVGAHHEAVHAEAAAQPTGRARSSVERQQDRAAAARRDEALDGSADPSLQALHRRRPRAGRRGLRRRRGAQGRVRRLSGRRRHQQALQVQDPRAGLRPSAGDGSHRARAICWPTSRPSSARSTSCSGRSTGDDVRIRTARS